MLVCYLFPLFTNLPRYHLSSGYALFIPWLLYSNVYWANIADPGIGVSLYQS